MTSDYLSCFLVVLFGCGSWVAVNGIWSESPVLWPLSPDCLRLPSITIVTVQVANVGPLVYLLVSRLCCRGKERQAQTVAICVIYVLGLLACGLLSAFWDRTSMVGGHRHSTALIVLLFVLALVDCTSSVTFLPFMARYPIYYLNFLYIGEGLSGLIPSIIGLIQTADVTMGNGSYSSPYNCSLPIVPTRFSPTTYFGILVVLVFGSAIGFFLLRCFGSLSMSPSGEANEKEQLIQTERDEVFGDRLVASDSIQSSQQQIFWSQKLVVLLSLEMWINCLSNGLIPAVTSYAFTPYGSADVIVNVGMLAGPITAFAAVVLVWNDSVGRPAFATIGAMVFVATILSGYIMWIASPMCNRDRPLQGSTMGTVHMVLSNVALTASVAYAKVAIARGAKELVEEKALLACGIATQIGSFVGAFTIFGFVNTGYFDQPSRAVC